MESSSSSKRGGTLPPKGSSHQNFTGPNPLQDTRRDASFFIGRIVEKGMGDGPSGKPFFPTPPPQPTVLPFPVARHRSHGPHWGPTATSNSGGMDDGDSGDYEDNDEGEEVYFPEYDSIAAFANPIQKKEKRGLYFSRWRELCATDSPSKSYKREKRVVAGANDGRKEKGGAAEFRDRGNMSGAQSLAQQDALTCKNIERNVESCRSYCRSTSETKEGIANSSASGFLESTAGIELLDSDKSSSLDNGKNQLSQEEINIPLSEQHTKLQEFSSKKISEPHAEFTDNFGSAFSSAQIYQEPRNVNKQLISSSAPHDFANEQGSLALESEIDAENCSRLQGMSPDEIAEAQAEIMEKIDPALQRILKIRGQNKSKKQKFSSKGMVTVSKPVDLPGENQLTGNEKDGPLSKSDALHGVKSTSSAGMQGMLDNGKNKSSASSTLWNAWSERVEAVRRLRFSLDGNVVENDFVKVPESGNKSGYSVDNVTDRDFLRTDGDPSAAGYTIKEAVALTRSVVPGQRALALHLLGAVLDKAMCNMQHNQVGHSLKAANNVDWEAVWAFALGPEPELVLSLRMLLDDNHNSVVLASAKVIQCVLSCDMNEKYFSILERAMSHDKNICIAPVFRRRPEIDAGFLHGGFWKYNCKPSNVLPFSEDILDDDTEGKHTIKDDVIVSGQDVVAGLLRMGILPRICYLLETNPTAALEECIISILIAVARHSPACADAIINCQRLLQTVVNRFTMKNGMEICQSMIKSVVFFKVLAHYDRKICIGFIENGIFRDMTWHLYQHVLSLDQWLRKGSKNCMLASALMVEQLRFWKVCIQFGYCISYFTDFFPALCLWLHPPTFEKLIDQNVLSEFAAISGEAFLVLGALARRLPHFYSQCNQSNQTSEFDHDNMETWCWSHVGPMIDFAVKWIAAKKNPYISKCFEQKKDINGEFVSQGQPLSPLLWVISSVMYMLSCVLNRIMPEDTIKVSGSKGLPWLPEFVPTVGLEIIKNGYLYFSNANTVENGVHSPRGCSFIAQLRHLRHQSDNETSLASVCCLHGLVHVTALIDELIQLARPVIRPSLANDHHSSIEGKILEDGILGWSQDELRCMLGTFMNLIASEWHHMQSAEFFGRSGPAPGVGLGWGSSGGGFWSTTILLAQEDAALLIRLLEILQVLSKDISVAEKMRFNMEKINAALGTCLCLGPRDQVMMEKAFDILFQVPVLKHIDLCARQHLHLSRGIKPFQWDFVEEDYLSFSKLLAFHFRNRWLCVKKRKKLDQKACKKVNNSLDTIHEDVDMSSISCQDFYRKNLVVEWAQQRLPLPLHWFLSPISTIQESGHATHSVSTEILDNLKGHSKFQQESRGGLFFLFGIEGMSSFLSPDIHSPVQDVPLIWKLHALTVILLSGMDVLEEEKSRDIYVALQEVYGQLLDEQRHGKSTEARMKKNEVLREKEREIDVEFLRFQSGIHESYSTFIESVVEQFAAISYGDQIFARQITLYLHRHVEAPVRLSTWNALSNAHVLELLPPLHKCIADGEGYLEPAEDNEFVLEAYVRSWTSGALDRATSRESVAFTLVLHHLSCFVFQNHSADMLVLRNKLIKSLLRDYSRKQQHEDMMLDLIQYYKPSLSRKPDLQVGPALQKDRVEKRFDLLKDACEGNSSLLNEIEKLRSSFRKNYNL